MNIKQYKELIQIKNILTGILQEEESKENFSQDLIDDLTQQLEKIKSLIPETIVIKINGELNFQVAIPYNINIELNTDNLEENNDDLYKIYDVLDQNPEIASIINSIDMENGEIRYYEIIYETFE